MARYILFLHDKPESFAKISPAEMGRVIAEYRAWSQKLRARNLLGGGEKLTGDPGRVLRGTGAELVVVEGPYAENRELVGGFFILNAGSYDEAVALSRDCPHLGYGGRIVLRQIEEME